LWSTLNKEDCDHDCDRLIERIVIYDGGSGDAAWLLPQLVSSRWTLLLSAYGHAMVFEHETRTDVLGMAAVLCSFLKQLMMRMRAWH
jgi:hypothetical protein